jgi:hypothetical protein
MTARCDRETEDENYLDLENSIFWVKEGDRMPKGYDVPEDFVRFVRSLKIKTWLLGSKRSSAQSVSTMFSRSAEVSYRTLKAMYGSDGESEGDSDSCRTDVTEAKVEVPVVLPVESVKIKPKIKVKVISSERLYGDGIEWSNFQDPNVRDVTNQMHYSNVKRMQESIIGVGDMFYPMAYVGEEMYMRVRKYLTDKEYQFNTWKKYLGGLCKMLAGTECGVADFMRYENLYLSVKRTIEMKSGVLIESCVSDKKSPDFLAVVLPKAKECYGKRECGLATRFYSLVIMNSVDWRQSEAIGVLRLDDIIKARISTDNEANSIDLHNRTWVIESDATKNKERRTIKLSQSFIDGLIDMYKDTDVKLDERGVPERGYLVLNDSKEPYNAPPSKRVAGYMGNNPTDIRSSYATYLYTENVPMKRFTEICANMGHAHVTSIRDYIVQSTDSLSVS